MLFLVCLVVIWIGCSSPDQKKGLNTASDNLAKSVMIDLPKTGEARLNASEFADTVMYIPLETNSKSFIRAILKVEITDKYILTCGFDQILLFSRDGKFIRQIGRKGKGPGEYANIFGFAVNGDTVFITSTGKRSVIKYTVNGDFVEELPAPLQMVYFEVSPDNNIVCYNKTKGQLLFFDHKLHITDTLTIDYNLSDKREFYAYFDSFETYFQKSGHRLLFTNYMSDTIWEVSKRKKEIGYLTNLGDQLLPANYQIEYFNGDFERYKKTAAPYQKVKLIETPSYIFIFQKGWIDNNVNSAYFHDVATNTTGKLDSPTIFDDLVGKHTLDQKFFTNDCLVSTLNPVTLIKELKQADQQKTTNAPSPLLVKQLANVKENDNPILVIMPVKNKMIKGN